MIDINRINEKRIKINKNFSKLLIIIIRIVVVKNVFQNLHHFFQLFSLKNY